MQGYESALAIHPGTSYGIVVLLTGHHSDAAKIAYDAFEIFQPAMDRLLAETSSYLYAGSWSSKDGPSKVTITVDNGVMWTREFVLNGVNILQTFRSPSGLALRPSGRRDEFR